MKKQTKIVAVTSAAAMLAIGAFMTSFAATGWVEEDGHKKNLYPQSSRTVNRGFLYHLICFRMDMGVNYLTRPFQSVTEPSLAFRVLLLVYSLAL